MSARKPPPTTRHRVRWGEQDGLIRQWRREPPTHPENPRYFGGEFRVEGQYSLFETIVNIFRDRGWLDPPPPEYKWAIVTVVYTAIDEPTLSSEFALA